MKRILGVSAFGLKDCVAQPKESCHELGFYLADAVLPMNPLGYIRTCDEAEDERTHAGLYWPPEARVQLGEPLRRVPIPYAWRALVEAGDRTARWNIGRGVSFPLPRILASHVAGLVSNGKSARSLPQRDDVQTESRETLPVVAIPDNLDEFGQEILLRELTALGLGGAMLVWRPVAAALSWVDKVEGDFPSRMGESSRCMGMNDHIHVVYLGPDAIEFTTFRLRVRKHKGQHYVLPLRDRPSGLPSLAGMDWAGRLIEESFEGIDHGAFWQAFTNFPEVWEAIADKPWNQEKLPRAWSQKQGWTLWNPSRSQYNQIYDVQAGPCDTLRDILRRSCELYSPEETHSGSIGDVLCREVRSRAQLFPGGRLRGMIVCGPLLSSEVPSWLAAEMNALAARGLDVDGDLSEPEAGRLWLCTDCIDPVAEGAAIYGRRTLAKIPSYFDTMPQISILAQGRGQYAWIPLLDAQEVLGGTEFKRTIRGRFQLDQGQRKLHVYLWKGPLENAPNEAAGPFDARGIPSEGISPCEARLVRKVVQELGSVEAVRNRGFFRGATRGARYGLAYATALFTEEDGEDDESPGLSSKGSVKTPLRRAIFDFPSVPDHDAVLDVDVRMRPASGLAKVELVPENTSFLEGGRVRLNYSTMREATKLPRSQRGWPSIQELVVDPNDDLLREGRVLVRLFENALPTNSNYKSIIDQIRDRVLKGTTLKWFAGVERWLHTIDQDGQACTREGNNIIRRIATKFESDFDELQRVQGKVFSRASWLYTSTPHNIVAYARNILAGNFRAKEWLWATEAASRTFVSEGDFRILFAAIASRARRNTGGVQPFPIQVARGVCRVLMFRENGEKALDKSMANLFAQRVFERLRQEQNRRNFQILYFQLILLLLYLLRYRRTDPACFDPSSPQSIEVFSRAMKSMAVAKDFFANKNQHVKAKRVQSVIDGFEKYLYYEGTEDVLTVLGDFAGDMA